jgi:2-C-methyl-D-erythritol 4-phosphate cytidylyltransferase/2-C-methyl-D-erythritol 2,4-cyclodiphosphate synthase
MTYGTHSVVVVLAAGAGRRLGDGDRPKAFVPIGDRSILSLAATAAAASSKVDRLVVVVPEGWQELAEDSLEDVGCPALVVVGGRTRQESVARALDAVGSEVRVIVVHDAARPFASPELFTAVIGELGEDAPGVVPVVPVTDTVKTLRDGMITGTLDREQLGLAQTPQAFRASVLRVAHERAAASGAVVTDDASVLELAGYGVKAIKGDPMNTKITTAFDLAQARSRSRGIDA